MAEDRGNTAPDPADPAKNRQPDDPALNRQPDDPAATEPNVPEPTPPAVPADSATGPDESRSVPGESRAASAPGDAGEPTESIGPVTSAGSDPWDGSDDDIFQLTGDSGSAETSVIPPVPAGADATTVMPAATEDPKWSARAGVPTRPRGAIPPEEWDAYEDPHGGRTWWLPILLSILALLLLAVVGIGAWLINQNRDNDVTSTPTPTATTPSSTPTSASPSSAPPTSASPTPTSIVLLNLIGFTEAAAIQYLEDNHIKHVSVQQESSTATPGTVIITSPPGGAIVGPDDVVTLTVAKAPPTPTGSTETPTPVVTTTGP